MSDFEFEVVKFVVSGREYYVRELDTEQVGKMFALMKGVDDPETRGTMMTKIVAALAMCDAEGNLAIPLEEQDKITDAQSLSSGWPRAPFRVARRAFAEAIRISDMESDALGN
jgi:hypothetical protein